VSAFIKLTLPEMCLPEVVQTERFEFSRIFVNFELARFWIIIMRVPFSWDSEILTKPKSKNRRRKKFFIEENKSRPVHEGKK
jgi:hypothetical protein